MFNKITIILISIFIFYTPLIYAQQIGEKFTLGRSFKFTKVLYKNENSIYILFEGLLSDVEGENRVRTDYSSRVHSQLEDKKRRKIIEFDYSYKKKREINIDLLGFVDLVDSGDGVFWAISKKLYVGKHICYLYKSKIDLNTMTIEEKTVLDKKENIKIGWYGNLESASVGGFYLAPSFNGKKYLSVYKPYNRKKEYIDIKIYDENLSIVKDLKNLPYTLEQWKDNVGNSFNGTSIGYLSGKSQPISPFSLINDKICHIDYKKITVFDDQIKPDKVFDLSLKGVKYKNTIFATPSEFTYDDGYIKSVQTTINANDITVHYDLIDLENFKRIKKKKFTINVPKYDEKPFLQRNNIECTVIGDHLYYLVNSTTFETKDTYSKVVNGRGGDYLHTTIKKENNGLDLISINLKTEQLEFYKNISIKQKYEGVYKKYGMGSLTKKVKYKALSPSIKYINQIALIEENEMKIVYNESLSNLESIESSSKDYTEFTYKKEDNNVVPVIMSIDNNTRKIVYDSSTLQDKNVIVTSGYSHQNLHFLISEVVSSEDKTKIDFRIIYF